MIENENYLEIKAGKRSFDKGLVLLIIGSVLLWAYIDLELIFPDAVPKEKIFLFRLAAICFFIPGSFYVFLPRYSRFLKKKKEVLIGFKLLGLVPLFWRMKFNRMFIDTKRGKRRFSNLQSYIKKYIICVEKEKKFKPLNFFSKIASFKRQQEAVDLFKKITSYYNIVPAKSLEQIKVELDIESGQVERLKLKTVFEDFILRNWLHSDMTSLVKFANNRNIWKNMTSEFPHPYSETDAYSWLGKVEQMSYQSDWAIEVDGVVVGNVGFILNKGMFNKTAQLIFWIGEQYWNKGIMSTALCELVPYIMDNFGLIRLEAHVFENNQAAMKVLEKSGFSNEALLKSAAFKDEKVVDLILFSKVKKTFTHPAYKTQITSIKSDQKQTIKTANKKSIKNF